MNFRKKSQHFFPKIHPFQRRQASLSCLQFAAGRMDAAQKPDFLCELGAAGMICRRPTFVRAHLLQSSSFISSDHHLFTPIFDELTDFGAFVCAHLQGSSSFISSFILHNILLFVDR